MPKSKSKTKEPEAKVEERREIRLSRTEVTNQVRAILAREGIAFLSVRCSLTEITIVQSGAHDSAGAICSLLEKPGIFGFDDNPEDGSEFKVTELKDIDDAVTQTTTTLSREFAEKVYEDAPDAEGDAEAEETEEVSAPLVETPEDIDKLKEPEVDALLKLHGLDPADMDKGLKAKREIAKNTVFID